MAQSGFGATITVGGSTAAEVTRITIPTVNGEVIDVTTHESVDRFAEYIRGGRSLGEGSFEMLLEAGSSTEDACLAAINSDSPVAVTITVKASTGTETLTYSAFGRTYDAGELTVDGRQEATFSYQPTGKVTQAPTA